MVEGPDYRVASALLNPTPPTPKGFEALLTDRCQSLLKPLRGQDMLKTEELASAGNSDVTTPLGPKRLKLPELDGLRTLAFLLVFIHHMPRAEWPALQVVSIYGWVGVELFFVISAFLFFHLLPVEFAKNGRISVLRFYTRRLLRIVPLLLSFVGAMFFLYGTTNPARVASLLLMVDNFAAWLQGYNTALPFVDHLWTLSFEFQAYLLIPIAFIAYKSTTPSRFLTAITVVAVFCIALRLTFMGLGAPHPVVWVTPFLRPESIFLGMALAVVKPKWPWQVSGIAFLVSGLCFINVAPPWESMASAAFSYPLAALMCCSLIDSVMRSPLKRVFSWWPLSALGVISYGLYVFHSWGRVKADGFIRSNMPWLINPDATTNYWVLFLLGIGVTIVVSTASYWVIERPFLRIKKRLTVADGRS